MIGRRSRNSLRRFAFSEEPFQFAPEGKYPIKQSIAFTAGFDP